MKKVLLILLAVFFLGLLSVTTLFSLRYMHWSTKITGYPGLYQKDIPYPFLPADQQLLEANWQSIAKDEAEDGDIFDWPDAKELLIYKAADTTWIAALLHNNLEISEPMISMAFESDEGKKWYGTVKFNYKEMISAGYTRKDGVYYGYNFVDNTDGVCTFKYSLKNNALYLGVPNTHLEKFKGRKFVVSVGYKSYWNDDFDALVEF